MMDDLFRIRGLWLMRAAFLLWRWLLAVFSILACA